ncbi:hypothetical protein Ahy_B07g087701 [Arachis hypogaea]|uniref:Aminotransferase-like plant mobile domain-containing protein n=1 Tax=Arachis hypogaea TaxID=3818 RepID=A0A444YCR2_ARAHY|nr:hypothetical protein Ahy_B07g087701 [Arachis hypogaea]
MTKSESGSTDKQYIDGFRLAEFKPNFPDTESNEDRFWAVFSLFHTCKDFDNDQLNFTPFLRRNRGPTWLECLLFPDTNEANEIANQNWANMLAVQVIPIGLPLHKKERFKITMYAPHLTTRQLEFSQDIPTPQPQNDDPFCHITLTTQEDFNSCLLKNQQRRDRFNFVMYDRSFYITKSCFKWWATYYSRYTRTLEEIQQTAIRTAVTESSPKKLTREKLKLLDHHQPRVKELLLELLVNKSADESEPTNKDSLAASSPSEDAADSDPGTQLIPRYRISQIDPEHSTSHDSIQFTGSLQTIPATHPPLPHTTQVIDLTANPLQHSPEENHRLESISPNNQAVSSTENIVVADSNSAFKAADTTNSTSSKSKVLETPPELQPKSSLQTPPDQNQEHRMFLLLQLDCLNSSLELPTNTPYSASIQEFKQLLNDSVASQFQLQETENEEAIAKSKIENCLTTAQPIQSSREEFDVRNSHAISVQAFHDQEEARIEAELAQLHQEQLATIRQSRATLAKPLAAAQQEQHLLIQKLVLIDTERGEYEKQLEKIQADKFKQIEILTILKNKRTKLRSNLVKLLAS